MKRIAICAFALLVAAGCSESPDSDGEILDSESDDRSYADRMAEVEEEQDTKGDEISSCGDESCQRILCGYSCTEEGQHCERSCADEDTRPDEFVSFETSGSVSTSADSRDYPYEPVVSLSNVLFYGCELWDFQNTGRQALDLRYAEIIEGAFQPGDPKDHARELVVEIDDFSGPGDYSGNVRFSETSDQYEADDYFEQDGVCDIDVRPNSGDGIEGDFDCGNVSHAKATRTISVTGSFECGANAVDGVRIIEWNRD